MITELQRFFTENTSKELNTLWRYYDFIIDVPTPNIQHPFQELSLLLSSLIVIIALWY